MMAMRRESLAMFSLHFLHEARPLLAYSALYSLSSWDSAIVANRRETDEWATRWLCRGTFLQPEDGEKQQQQTERQHQPQKQSGGARVPATRHQRGSGADGRSHSVADSVSAAMNEAEPWRNAQQQNKTNLVSNE